MKGVAETPVEVKKNQKKFQLYDHVSSGGNKRELIVQAISGKLGNQPFLFEDTQWLTVQRLNQKGQESVIKVLKELIFECGLDLYGKFLFELKFPPQKPDEKEENAENQETQNETP